MGVVYLAKDLSLGRQVAIKLLPEENTQNPDSLRRFLAEAKAASALNHPNIVTVYEVSNDAGRWFIAMEYVQGKTLGELIPPDGLPLRQGLQYASQTADALAAAHAAGVVHRDVKPGNIMVTDSGMVKVLDFGLAKLVTQAGPQDQTVRAGPATVPGTILGTFDYMSPEQAEGKEAGSRSDIFSFGALLSACLRKQPDRRIAGMREIHEALERLRQPTERIPASPAASIPSYSKAAAAIVIVALAAIAATLYFRTPSALPPEPLRVLPLTNYPGNELMPSFSPDGKQVAFSWNGEKQDNFDIYVKYLDSSTPLRLTKHEGVDTNPSWSPDGRWIVFQRSRKSDRSLLIVSPHGSEERTIVTLSGFAPGKLEWSPDSLFVLYGYLPKIDAAMQIRRVNIETGESAQITFPPSSGVGDSGPALSPDGKTLLFTRTKGNAADADVLALDMNTNCEPQGRPVKWLTGFFSPTAITWVPGDSQRVLFISNYSSLPSLWQSRITGSGAQRRLARPERVEGLPPVQRLAVTRTGPPFGIAIDSLRQDINLRTVHLPGGKISATPVGGSSFNEEAGSYSPDGTRIAFRSSRDGDINLWVSNTDGTAARQLTRFKGHNIGNAAWSPDGREIIIGVSQGADLNLQRVDANSGAIRNLLATPANENNARWSPDGRWIYFTSDRSGQVQIWRMPAIGGEPRQVTTSGAANPKFSPDGKYLYYRVTQGMVGSLWRMPAEGGTPEQVVDRVIWTNWVAVPDGLYYTDLRNLWFLPNGHKTARLVTAFSHRLGAGLDLHPGGKTLLVTLIEGEQSSELMYVPNFR